MSEVWTFYGAEATGKTSLGFSAIRTFLDGIMIHFDFDLGRERAIWRFGNVADRIKTVTFPEVPTWTLGSGAITKSWARFEQVFEVALSDPQVKVLFVDTGTQMHRLNADEYLENYVKRNKPNRHQLVQMEYRVPNSRTRTKIMAARGAGKLLIISHYEAAIYAEQFVQKSDGSMSKESVNTGRKTHAGFGETAYMADQHLQLVLKDVNAGVDGKLVAGMSPNLVTFAKFLKPNPPGVFGMEVAQPTYERLTQFVDGIKKVSLGMEEIG